MNLENEFGTPEEFLAASEDIIQRKAQGALKTVLNIQNAKTIALGDSIIKTLRLSRVHKAGKLPLLS